MAKSEEENYGCALSESTRTIARVELREDDAIREETLKQFRDWIQKHPNIKRCRTDAAFLLRFLRTKKFSVPMAEEMLERYLTIRQLYPNWFQNLDVEDKDIEAIIDAGYLIPLMQRDRHGRRVILSCAGRFDPYKYTSAQMARAHSLVVESLMDDEENQVRGYTHINDESGLTMGHLSAWSLTDIRNMLRCIQNSTPMRHKETHFVNIPSCAIKVIEFGISLLNDKLKNRILVRTLVCAILQFSLIERSSSIDLSAILPCQGTQEPGRIENGDRSENLAERVRRRNSTLRDDRKFQEDFEGTEESYKGARRHVHRDYVDGLSLRFDQRRSVRYLWLFPQTRSRLIFFLPGERDPLSRLFAFFRSRRNDLNESRTYSRS